LNKDNFLRISVLAKQFSGIRVLEYRSDSFKIRIVAGLSSAWAKVRGHEIISLEEEVAERLLTLSHKTGQDYNTITASALAFVKLIAETPDNYTVIRDKEGMK